MELGTEMLQELEAATDQWTDQRIIHKDDLRDLLMLHIYGQKVFSELGMGLSGWVCRQRNGQTLLTVKVTEDQTPLVVFITSASPMGCVSKLFDLMEKDRLSYSRDRYPWI